MVIFVNVALTKKLSTPKAEAAWPGKKFKHSGENPQTFRECSQTSRGMLLNIPRNVVNNSGECPQTFQGMFLNIPENVARHYGECFQTFRGMLLNIPGNAAKHSGECSQTFGGMWEKWLWDFVCVECLGLMIGLMLFLLVSFSSIWF